MIEKALRRRRLSAETQASAHRCAKAEGEGMPRTWIEWHRDDIDRLQFTDEASKPQWLRARNFEVTHLKLEITVDEQAHTVEGSSTPACAIPGHP